MIKLFDIIDNQVQPTEHCYTLLPLKRIMEMYPEEYMSIYAYLFYMTCPDEEQNPFFNTPDHEREYMIGQNINMDFSTEDDLILEGLQFCRKLYETPTARAFKAAVIAQDAISEFLTTVTITTGRDGNLGEVGKALKDMPSVREAVKLLSKDLKDEQTASTGRGGTKLAYDAM